ncbi:MAG TPA: O-antigen ligase family protein [Ignavibacteriaceae bacterium]|nr:O-antigen ligase family protein [Ignavibacteriaceae bacterium]
MRTEILSWEKEKLTSNVLYFTIGVLLLLPLTIIISKLNTLLAIAIFLSVPVVIISLFNFRLVYSLLIISLFFIISYFRFTTSVLFTAIFYLAFLINFRELKFSDFKSPLTLPIIIYLLSVLPSLMNTIKVSTSLLLMYNFIAIVFTMYITLAATDDHGDIRLYIKVFLSMVFINGLFVIYEAVKLDVRTFGFTGIMYVDYVGLAIVITFCFSLFNYGAKRLFYLSLLFIFVVMSFLTQTRNPWISIIFTIIIMLFYSIRKSGELKINKRLLIGILMIFIIAIPLTYITIQNLNPDLVSRVQAKSLEGTFDQYGMVENSLVSRALIWDTALNAFFHHPVIGIGVYSFPLSSEMYSEIPKFLYDLYVKGVTPHMGYLAVITETGVIGFIGFMILILAIIKLIFQNLSLAGSADDNLLTSMLSWSLMYITISLGMTDAWLWGQGPILWGILLGLTLAQRKLLLNKSAAANKKLILP